MDYSFNDVNQEALPLAPHSSMQFGNTLQRIHAAFGPPLLAKIDMADGYYRIPLSADASLQLAVVLPTDDGEEPLLGLPLSLPMGWSLSPPLFCAFMETCADLVNTKPVSELEHPYPEATQPQIPVTQHTVFHPDAIFPYNPHQPDNKLQYTDVYMDDFILLAQRLNHTHPMHSLLHHLHSIFQDPIDSPR
jgi:hypothetical protein